MSEVRQFGHGIVKPDAKTVKVSLDSLMRHVREEMDLTNKSVEDYQQPLKAIEDRVLSLFEDEVLSTNISNWYF